MDVPALCFQFSYKKCFWFLLLITSLLILISVFFLLIIFVLKPRRPIFSFQTMNIVSYKFDVSDSSTLFVSLVASVTLIAQNPNRIGIKYDFSRLEIINEGLVIGLIRTPEFYQPARSHNVSVKLNLVFECLDITTIMSGVDASNLSIKVLGDIGVRLRVLQIKLPKIKVGLDCDVAVDGKYLTSMDDEITSLKAIKNHIAHFDANSQAFSKKCSIVFHQHFGYSFGLLVFPSAQIENGTSTCNQDSIRVDNRLTQRTTKQTPSFSRLVSVHHLDLLYLGLLTKMSKVRALWQASLTATKRALTWNIEDMLPPSERFIYNFNSKEELKKWHLYSDSEYGGLSSAALEINDAGNERSGPGVFSGNLSLDVTEGTKWNISRSGFCGMRSKKFDGFIDLDPYDTIALKVKGDGRSYISTIYTENWVNSPGQMEDNSWQAFVCVPKNNWVVAKIPIAHYLPTWRGNVIEADIEMNPSKVVGMSLSVNAEGGVPGTETGPGDFRLEIDWIKALRTE
ncbi:hypothetical protein L6452_07873 [Arctium lappa]|uniref:Uncharacterized protein n=1 Tax=Arctium lappa TaxID=4217 RepID=A0ACB9ELA8_ARCLA|nr:hypothetical protein L6452_07873 [Arctium lappa]